MRKQARGPGREVVRSTRIGVQLAVLVFAGLAAPSAEAVFTDVTESAGLAYEQYGGTGSALCLTNPSIFSCEMEWMSGGAAVADVDGDGWTDLYVTRLDAPDLLFRNRGGRFVDVTAEAGLSGFDLQSNGAAFADIDNDGDPDLYVSVMGLGSDPVNNRFYLFVNDGSGVFTEEAVARGAEVVSSNDRGGFGVAFGDYDRDGWVDLYVAEWGQIDLAGPALPVSRLLRNRGAAAPGHFEDVTASAGVEIDRSPECLQGTTCSSLAFAPAFVDLDGDGWPELAIAADFGTSLLFWNDGDGTFTEGTVAAGVGTDENGMGSTFGDYDGDGDLDWFVTSIFDPDETCEETFCNWGYSGNRLFRNDGDRSFSDQTDAAGVRDGRWGWGTSFFDADNDGDLDLVMTNGIRFPLTPADDVFHDDPMRYWRNDGPGPFFELSASLRLTDTASGKGLLHFDYDRDGDLDLFWVNNGSDGGRLMRNDRPRRNGWLRLRLQGELSNRDAFGARVELTATPGGPTQVRQIGASSHYLGQSERVAHFGLGPGSDPVHRVVVHWPSGLTTTYSDLPRDRERWLVEAARNLPLLSPLARAALVALLVGLALRGTRTRWRVGDAQAGRWK